MHPNNRQWAYKCSFLSFKMSLADSKEAAKREGRKDKSYSFLLPLGKHWTRFTRPWQIQQDTERGNKLLRLFLLKVTSSWRSCKLLSSSLTSTAGWASWKVSILGGYYLLTYLSKDHHVGYDVFMQHSSKITCRIVFALDICAVTSGSAVRSSEAPALSCPRDTSTTLISWNLI